MEIKDNTFPLVADLDGTLVKTDTLLESIFGLIRLNYIYSISMIFWFLKGRNFLKQKIAEKFIPDPSLLPYNNEVLIKLKDAKQQGRKIVLATGSHQLVADEVASYLNIFDDVYGSTESVNLTGNRKRDLLVERYGEASYEYIGDSFQDLPVWKTASEIVSINPTPYVKNRLKTYTQPVDIIENKKNYFTTLVKEIRIYQWVKNLLIFLPLLMAHEFDDPQKFVMAIIGFFCFSFVASAVYLFNDIFDVEADRAHPSKKNRPIASGNFGIVDAVVISTIMNTIGMTVAAAVMPFEFFITLLIYQLSTSVYSFLLKKIYVLDIIYLAALYTIRLLSGAFATGVEASTWLLAFSMFIFLSLAFLKRFVELVQLSAENKNIAKGRAYNTEDISALRSFGTSSAYISILVFALYIQSEKIVILYKTPELLWLVVPLLLYWITRMWFLAEKGKVDDDPVVFTCKDPVSYIVAILSAVVLVGATL